MVNVQKDRTKLFSLPYYLYDIIKNKGEARQLYLILNTTFLKNSDIIYFKLDMLYLFC